MIRRRDTIRYCGQPAWWWYLWASAITAALSGCFWWVIP